MYTIKNISSKIIHIGTTVLMPDDAMKAPDAIAKSASIKALAKRKMLEITAPVVEAPKDEKNAEQHDEQFNEQADDGETVTFSPLLAT